MREVPLRLRRIAWGAGTEGDPDSDARRKCDHIFYSLPPNPPKDRVQLLRRAFQETMNDAEFLFSTRVDGSDHAKFEDG